MDPSSSSSSSSSTDLILLIWYNHPWADHWGLYIPSSSDRYTGTLVHATGNPRAGFKLEERRWTLPRPEDETKESEELDPGAGVVYKTPPKEHLIGSIPLNRDVLVAKLKAIDPPVKTALTFEERTAKIEAEGVKAKHSLLDCRDWVFSVLDNFAGQDYIDADAVTAAKAKRR